MVMSKGRPNPTLAVTVRNVTMTSATGGVINRSRYNVKNKPASLQEKIQKEELS